ncbi:MAG: hypothetical protein R2704_16355 [Microthrixaceae bacterium]
MALVPVFISFDHDHDLDCKNLLVGQAKNPDTPFETSDHSVKVPRLAGRTTLGAALARVQQVIVICGEHTHTRHRRERGDPDRSIRRRSPTSY